MSRIGIAAAALGAVLAAGCAGVDERYAEQMMLGQQYFRNDKYYDAIGRFTSAFELASNNRERYQAMLAVAEASTEYGLICYEIAERYLRQNPKHKTGLEKWRDADKWHEDANKAFHKCLEMRSDDTIANYGLGKLYYKRATSFSVLPFTESEKGVAARKLERDEAVRQFQIVLGHERGDITLPEHGPVCQSAHVHRYLAMALLTRSDWDKNDGEEARRHMMVYLNYLKWASKSVSDAQLPGDDPDRAKLEKEQRIEYLRRQIVETRSLLATQLQGLEHLVESWKAGTEKPPLPKDKREVWLDMAQREINALQHLTREFEEAATASRRKPKPAPEKEN